MARTQKAAPAHASRGRIVLLLAFLLLLYVVLPQIQGFSDSFAVLRRANWSLVACGFVLVVATYIAAACIYQLLALKRLRFFQTLAVQGAGAFANKVLPAGIGGLALNVRYLRRTGHSLPQAITVAGANNMTGFIGHGLLLVIILLSTGVSLGGKLALPDIAFGWYVAVVVIALGLASVLFVRKVRRSIGGTLFAMLQVLLTYRTRWARLLAALGVSICLTLLYVAIFYVACQAVGVAIDPTQALIIFTLGMIIGTVTPTPGGLGGIEAGLVAGTLTYGHSASAALAAALLFRLLTYWVPLLPGFLLLATIRNKYL